MFDEGLNANFAEHVLQKTPYFDVHPPLAQMLFALVAGSHQSPEKQLYTIGDSFQTFPYIRARALNVLLGALLAPIILLIAYLLFENRLYALFSAFLVVFDNALIVYSRSMLPDTHLLLFGALGALFFLLSVKNGAIFYLLLAGVFLGAALSVKWIGLGFLAPALLYLLIKKRPFSIAALVFIAAIVYIAVFHIYFGFFDGKEFADKDFASYRYPTGERILDTVKFLPGHTIAMFKTNFTLKEHPYASHPVWWPLGKSMGFWTGEQGRIVLVPNLLSWWLTYLSVLVATVLICMRKHTFIEQNEKKLFAFLVFSYFILYLPFFGISRSLFVYHYFSALLAGYMLMPPVLRAAVSMLKPEANTKRALTWFAVLIVISWLVAAPLTYGFPI